MKRMRSLLSRNDEVDFATTAKALMLVLAATGTGLLVAATINPSAPAVLPGVIGTIEAASISDPDAELRVWLSEAPPPTF